MATSSMATSPVATCWIKTKVLGVAAAAMLLGACAGGAPAYRTIVNDGSAEPLSQAAILRAANRLPESMAVVRSGKAAARLDRVSERVANTVPGKTDWTFLMVADDTVNTWSLPPHSIVFTSGLVTRLTDEELAGLVGKQIAHVRLGHQDRLFEQIEVEVASIVPERGIEADVSDEELYMDAVADVVADMVSNGFAGMPFDEKMELEADHMGAYYMARAGYDPRALLTMWSKFDRMHEKGEADMVILTIHSNGKNRLARLAARMPDYLLAYADMRKGIDLPSRKSKGGFTRFFR